MRYALVRWMHDAGSIKYPAVKPQDFADDVTDDEAAQQVAAELGTGATAQFFPDEASRDQKYAELTGASIKQ